MDRQPTHPLAYAMHRHIPKGQDASKVRRHQSFGLNNWEKSHFMVKEGIVLGHKISKKGIEVDKAKVDVIAKLPHPTTVKGVWSFLGHADWDLPFELMCDASDFAIGAVLGKHHEKHFRPIHYASKTMNKAESHYITTEKEMPRLLWWVLLLQEFDFNVIDTIGAENLAAEHLSRLKNTYENVLDPKEVNEKFPLETLNMMTSRGDSSTHVFADLCKLPHEELPLLKGCRSSRKTIVLKYVRSKDSAVVAGQKPVDIRTVFAIVYPIQARVRKCMSSTNRAGTKPTGLKHANFDLETAGDHRKVQLNELNELRDHAYENSLIYKEKTKRIHDSKIKNRVFNVGDQVLLFNSRLKMFSGKLKSRWSGPFTITQVFPYGTVELSQNSRPNFKVNGHRIKHYFGGDVPQLVVPDLQTFPKDK
ncbi:reverse transcriptase domain-containing protein [Tanacetum coccineum]